MPTFDENLFLGEPSEPMEAPTYFFQPGTFIGLPADEQLYLWRHTRAVAAWNQRAALLKAVSAGLQGTPLSDAQRDIRLINDWFAEKHYESNIDTITGRTVTPLIDAATLLRLANENNRAAQDIGRTAIAADLVRIGTDLANVARQNIGGPVQRTGGQLAGTPGRPRVPLNETAESVRDVGPSSRSVITAAVLGACAAVALIFIMKAKD